MPGRNHPAASHGTRNKTGGIQAIGQIALALHQRQTHQRLNPGEQNFSSVLDVLVIQRRGRTHVHPPGFIVMAAPGERRCLVIGWSLGSSFAIVKSQNNGAVSDIQIPQRTLFFTLL